MADDLASRKRTELERELLKRQARTRRNKLVEAHARALNAGVDVSAELARIDAAIRELERLVRKARA